MGMINILDNGLLTDDDNNICVTVDVDAVWDRNFESILKAINYVKYRFGVKEDNFVLEAQNIFYKNFDKKYENDNGYLAYFFTCIKNKAISIYNKQITWERRHVSNPADVSSGLGVYYNPDTPDVDVISASVEDKRIDTRSSITVKEIDELMKGMLDDIDFEVYQALKEGWTLVEISEITELSVVKIQNIRKRIQFAVKQVTDMSEEEYKRLTTKRINSNEEAEEEISY